MTRPGRRVEADDEANEHGAVESPSRRNVRAAREESDLGSASDRALVAAMRREQAAALIEFFRRFRPLLVQEARWLGVQPALRSELVDECLDDVALRLLRHTTPIPRAIAPYLIRALRLQRLKHRRGEARRASVIAEPSEYGDGRACTVSESTRTSDADQQVVSARAEATLSESAKRESRGPAWEPRALSPALERLVRMLEERLTENEALLLTWVGNWVPQSEIASWLGITHGAARNRVLRIRERLKETALHVISSFSSDEQAELVAFFRRTSTIGRSASATSIAASTPAVNPPGGVHDDHHGDDPFPASTVVARPVRAGRSDATRS